MTASTSRRRRLILHIGTHKTGTTAIQWHFSADPATLAAGGLIYPLDMPATAQFNQAHHHIAWHVLGLHKQNRNLGYDEAFCSRIRQRLAELPPGDIFLSSEELDRLLPPQIRDLRSLLADCDVTVLLYVRRQDVFVQSMYQTDVSYGFGKDRSLEERLEDSRLDYFELAQSWAEVFGKENVIVRVFEREQLVGRDAVRDCLAVLSGLGYAIDDSRLPTRRLNGGLSTAFVELVRRIAVDSPQKDRLWEVARTVGSALYPDGADDHRFLSPSQRRALNEAHAASNARLAREYLGRADGVLFRDLDVSGTDEEWRAVYQDPAALLIRLLEDVRQRIER